MEQNATIVAREQVMSSCIGAVGEVLTQDNRMLFVGRLEDYDEASRDLQIELHRGRETPRGILHGMPVKVQVHPRRGWSSVVVLYGTVSVCAELYWKITIENAVVCAESRRAFRQKVRAEAWVHWGEDASNRAQCQVADVSLVGIGFTSKADLPLQEQVTVSIPQLVKDGPAYELTCTLVGRRNTAPEGLPPLWHYGGDFGSLDERTESKLCKDIFALQAKSVNRER